MIMILYVTILALLAFLEINHAFEIASSHDEMWSYINITCDKSLKKLKKEIKKEELLDFYNDFEKSLVPRSISRASKLQFYQHLQQPKNNRIEREVNNGNLENLKITNVNNVMGETVNLKENTIKGSERVLLFTKCDTIIFKSGAASDVVKSLFVHSEGSLILEQGWFGTNITVLKLSAEKFQLPINCSWLPPSLKQLDISGSNDVDFSECRSEIKMLSLVDAGLNTTTFCFNGLESLDLSSNNIHSIEIIEECGSNIRELKVSKNKIRDWSLCRFPNLVYLSMDHNFITKIDLSNCSYDKLFKIDASHNKLTQFPYALPDRLAILILSYNKIENISSIENSFKLLDLSHNIIRRLTKGVFRLAWDLNELNLSHNLLSIIHGSDFSGLRLLSILDLSHNKIQHIRLKAFSTLVNLEALHLNGNNLHKLDTRLLAYLPNNIKFWAHGNPWSCSCYLLAELSKITRSSCVPDCHHKQLKCKQGQTWLPAPTILQKCLRAVQSNLDSSFGYQASPESDEDISEQKEEMSILAVHSGLILIFLLVIGAITSKVYTERKYLKRRFCNCLEPSSLQTVKNGKCLTSVGSNCIHDSESETEF